VASIHMTTKWLCLNDEKKTTIALEPCFWEALQDICQWEGKSLTTMVREVEALKAEDYPLTSAIRLFILRYHRSGGAVHRKTPAAERNIAPEIEQSQTSSTGDSRVESEPVGG
jgi:predicted DNA-binding ribbon-helix-helix protein